MKCECSIRTDAGSLAQTRIEAPSTVAALTELFTRPHIVAYFTKRPFAPFSMSVSVVERGHDELAEKLKSGNAEKLKSDKEEAA